MSEVGDNEVIVWCFYFVLLLECVYEVLMIDVGWV